MANEALIQPQPSSGSLFLTSRSQVSSRLSLSRCSFFLKKNLGRIFQSNIYPSLSLSLWLNQFDRLTITLYKRPLPLSMHLTPPSNGFYLPPRLFSSLSQLPLIPLLCISIQSRYPQPVLGQGQALGWVERSPWCVVASTRHIWVLRCAGPSWPGPTQPPLPCNYQPWGAHLLWWKCYLPSKLPWIVCFVFFFFFLFWDFLGVIWYVTSTSDWEKITCLSIP